MLHLEGNQELSQLGCAGQRLFGSCHKHHQIDGRCKQRGKGFLPPELIIRDGVFSYPAAISRLTKYSLKGQAPTYNGKSLLHCLCTPKQPSLFLRGQKHSVHLSSCPRRRVLLPPEEALDRSPQFGLKDVYVCLDGVLPALYYFSHIEPLGHELRTAGRGAQAVPPGAPPHLSDPQEARPRRPGLVLP